MTIKSYTTSFNGGEVAPSLYGRVDDQQTRMAVAQALNVIIEPQGPVRRRPGFEFVDVAGDETQPVRLIPFDFSLTESLCLELGAGYMRVHAQGQTVMDGNKPYQITTPYQGKDLMDLHYVQSADVVTIVHPDYPPMELRRYGATDWRLEPISFVSRLTSPGAPKVEQKINTNYKGDLTSIIPNPKAYRREYVVTSALKDGTQESLPSPSTAIDCNPYGQDAFNRISWTAVTGAELYRVYRKNGGVYCYVGQTADTTIDDDNIKADASITPPNYDDAFNTSGVITSVQVTNPGKNYALGPLKDLTLTAGGLSGTGQRTTDAGAKEDVTIWATAITSMEVLQPTAGTGSGAAVQLNDAGKDTATVTVSNGGKGYLPGGKVIVHWSGSQRFTYTPALGDPQTETVTVTGTAEFSYTITTSPVILTLEDATGSGAHLTATLDLSAAGQGGIKAVNVIDGGYSYTNKAKIKVATATGSGAAFAITVATSVGDYPGSVSYFEQRRWFGGTKLRPSNVWATKSGTESNMIYSVPSQDADRIAVRIAARDANRIEHIVPLQQLLLLTSSAVWRISPLNSDAITPQSMSARIQSYTGANNVQPIVAQELLVFADARGGHLQAYGYSYEAGGYTGRDLCIRAPHLFDFNEIKDMAASKAPWPIVWAVSSTGKLLALTFVPDQSVTAFATIETAGRIESVCVIHEGVEDTLYAVVSRTINGKARKFIERLHEIKGDSVYLDCAGTYRGECKQDIGGLTWLEGEKVAIYADGGVEPEQTVVNGTVHLAQPAREVHIGLPYTSQITTLPLAPQTQDGGFATTQRKNLRSITVRVDGTAALKAGPDEEHLTQYAPRAQEVMGAAAATITGVIQVEFTPKWDASGQVVLRQDQPLPMRLINLTTSYTLA